MLTFTIKKKRTPSISPKRHASTVSPMSHSLHLQQAKVRHMLRSPTLQPKLTIGKPNDKYEQEADRVADEVIRMPEPRLQRQAEEEEEELIQTKPLAEQITPLVQRQMEEEEEEEEEPIQAKPAGDIRLQRQEAEPEEEEEEPVQAKQAGGQTLQTGPGLTGRIRSLKGGGQPLSKPDRAFFESRFGHDFSQVRVHTGTRAEKTTKQLNARAFTIGRNIVFGAEQYAPRTSNGKKLLAHELTHVIQQKTMPYSNSQANKLVQRRGAAQKICNRVKPSPPVPQIKDVFFKYMPFKVLGPFYQVLGLPCHIFSAGKLIKNVPSHYRELKKKEEPFNRKTIIKINNFINKNLKRNKKLTQKNFVTFVFGFRKAPKQLIGAETKMFLSAKETPWEHWHTIGYVYKPKTSNPFYNWAALLHEQHHSATAKKGFNVKIEKKLLDLKKTILQMPTKQFIGATQAKVNQLKKSLRNITNPIGIYKFIKSHPLLSFEYSVLRSSFKNLYNNWVQWFSQTINLAKEELAAYCISWSAIRRGMKFIRQCCSSRALKPSRRRKRRRR